MVKFVKSVNQIVYEVVEKVNKKLKGYKCKIVGSREIDMDTWIVCKYKKGWWLSRYKQFMLSAEDGKIKYGTMNNVSDKELEFVNGVEGIAVKGELELLDLRGLVEEGDVKDVSQYEEY